MVEQIFISIILAKCFEILRQPGEILSFWNRLFIGWDDDLPAIIKAPKGYPFFIYAFEFMIITAMYMKPILHKVFTCSLCHSGYVAIYFICKGTDFIILPIVLVGYHFLNTVIYAK